jgi:hypothetical protein
MVGHVLPMQELANLISKCGLFTLYGAGSHGNTPALLEYIKPIIDTYKASAFLSGHDHILQHLRDSSSDVHYIGSGTGCKSSSRATILPQTLFVR